MLATAVLALTWLAAPPLFEVPVVGTFDGEGFGGIAFGTTDAELKKQFLTTKSVVRPEALGLVSLDRENPRVHALLNGRGGKAQVTAFCLPDVPLSPEDIGQAFEEDGLLLFERSRYQDWAVAAWPESGAVMILLPDRSRTLLLASPSKVSALVARLEDRETSIVRIEDPGEGWDGQAYVGRWTVDLSLPGSRPSALNLGWYNRTLEAMEGIVERAMSVYYDPDANGSLSIVTRTRGYERDGETDYICEGFLTVDTPYGRIRVQADDKIRADDSHQDKIEELTSSVASALNSAYASALRAKRPPRPESFTSKSINRIYDELTGTRRN